MSTGFPFFLSAAHEEHAHLRKNWYWFIVLGILLLITGILAISFPVLWTFVSVEVFGYLMVFGGAVEIVSSVWARRWSGFFLHVLTGLLYLFLGIVLIDRPVLGAAAYTLVLAIFFVAGGLFRAITAAAQRFSGWGWALFSGAITFLLGILIWRNLPEAAFWVIGTFLGIELIFNGWTWIMLALAVKNFPATEQQPPLQPS